MAIPICQVLTEDGMNKLLTELKTAMDKIYASKDYVDEKLINVSCTILTDTVTGIKYNLSIEDGVLTITETDKTSILDTIVLTDTVTGSKYTIIVENGKLLLVEIP